MKQFKTLVALVLALMLMTSTALAATITIKQPAPSDGTAGAESYALYKIFDVTKTADQSSWEQTDSNLGAGTAKGFSYTISTSNPWFAKLGSVSGGTWSAASGQTWVTLTPSAGDSTKYNVTWTGATNDEDAAKAFADWLLDNKGTIAADKNMTSNGTTASETVDDGYWLITSTLGTSLVLATSNITINTKNEYITDEKKVAKTNYNVGDQVEYTITVNLPASIDYTKPVIVHDTMDNVLALTDSSVSAKIGEERFTGITLVKSDVFGTDHDNTNHAAAEGKVLYDFVLDISSLAPAANADPVAKTIVITYTAELLSTAAADTDYVNKEFTEYSKYKTNPNEVKVKTFDFDLKKVFTGNTNKALEATFKLYPTVSGAKGTTAIQFINGGTVTGKDVTYVKADTDDSGASDIITVKVDTTNKSLVTNVRGLEAGTYYLTEQTTADGYNLLTTDVVITIDADGNATVGAGDLFNATDSTITVTNNSGSVLPSTGGIGTTIFYIAGAVLVLGAAAIVIARRKAEQH